MVDEPNDASTTVPGDEADGTREGVATILELAGFTGGVVLHRPFCSAVNLSGLYLSLMILLARGACVPSSILRFLAFGSCAANDLTPSLAAGLALMVVPGSGVAP